MKKYLRLIFALLILLIIGNVLVIWNAGKGNTRDQEPPVDYYYLTELYQFTLQNELMSIANPQVYLGNDADSTRFLSDLVESPTLVFRFSGEACSVCTDFVIKELRRTFQDFRSEGRIILLGSNVSNAIKEDHYGKNVTSLLLDDLNLPFEQYNIPFFFILDSDFKCKMMFIPDKSFPDLTKYYLETIRARFSISEP